MSRWTIYDKDGNVLHESIEKFDGKGKAVEQDTLEYSGKWMGDCFITVSFKSAYPIDFQIGDYIMYRGEKFTINYDPTVIKKSSRGTYGEGFTYDSVKFNALSNELTDAKFHDWVLSDNKIHYSSLPNFSFYAKDMNDLADRLQACTDKWCKDNGFAKENYWIFYTPGSGGDTNPYDRTIQRAKDISTDSTFIQNVLTRWKQIYGDGGTLVARDDERLDKSISVSNQTVWQGMAMFKSQFGLNFIVRGREVIVGSAGVLSSHIFQYGKDKGLYEVQKQADTDQKVVTRLHAYGSSDNLPTRYYAELDMKVSASVTDVDKEKDYMRLTLDMPFKPSMYTQKLSKYGDNIYAIRLMLDGTEINARVEGDDDKGKVKIYSEYLEASEDPDDNTDKNTYDAFYNSVKAGSKVYITGGVNKDLAPAGSIDYSMNALPNNMAVMNLMLPGFPKYALSDICKSEYDTNTDTTSYYIRKSKDSSEWVLFHSEQGKHVVRFSSDQYDPYIVSQNADVLGYKDDDIFCTEENDDNGLKKVYPSVEEVTEAEAGVSSSNDYINTIVSADVIKDNGVFSSKTGTTIPGFQVKIKNLGFNLQDAIAAAGGDGCKLSMKDGHCGGRDFDVPSVSKNNDGTWTLNCKRSQDSSLDLYYPYSYSASIGGTPNATESYQICSGDHYVLTGIALEATNYVWAASVKLLRKAIHWLCKNDYSRYTYSPKIDEIYMARQDEEAKASEGKIKSLHDTLKEGDLLWFKDEDLLLDGKVYIDQLVIKENGNNGIPTYDVTLRNEVQVGTIQRIQNKVDSISNDIRNGNIGGGVNPSTVENITTAVGDTRYLRKDQDDETTHKLTMGEAAVKGDATVDGTAKSTNYTHTGFPFGKGWAAMKDDGHGASMLEVDKLFVRMKAYFAELEIRKISYLGGNYVFSSGGGKIYYVEWLDANGKILEQTEANKSLVYTFRCYLYSDDGTTQTMNWFKVDDQVRCQNFGDLNGSPTDNYTSHYWWRRVSAVGSGEIAAKGDGKTYQYIDFDNSSSEQYAEHSDMPRVGDVMVQLGNWSDAERQSAIEICVIGAYAPAFIEWQGIGANNAHFKMPESSYTRLSPKAGNIIRGELINVVDGEGKSVSDIISDMESKLSEIQKQADKKFEIWFGDGEPHPNSTTDTAAETTPSSEWTTAAEKNLHVQDIYYDINLEAASNGGRAWRYISVTKDSTTTYYWEKVTDQDTLNALEKICKMQNEHDLKNYLVLFGNAVFDKISSDLDSRGSVNVWLKPASDPTGKKGDIWYDGTNCKIFGTEWTVQTDVSLANALADIEKILGEGKKFVIFGKENSEAQEEHDIELYKYKFTSQSTQKEISSKLQISVWNGKTWEPVQSSDTGILQNLGNEIDAVVMGSDGQGGEIQTGLMSVKGLATVVNKNFNADGSVKESGLKASDGTEMYTKLVGSDGKVISSATVTTGIQYVDETGKWTSVAKIKANYIDLEGYTTINGAFHVDEKGNVTMNDAVMNNANITGGTLTVGSNNKIVITTPLNEPGGTITGYQGSLDMLKIGITDTNGAEFSSFNAAFYDDGNQTIAKNVAVGPYIRLGNFHQGGGAVFSFWSQNFFYNKHVESLVLNTGGLLFNPIEVNDDIGDLHHQISLDAVDAIGTEYGRDDYFYPSVLLFKNTKAMEFTLGDPTARDSRGLIKNKGRFLMCWHMGENVTFKAKSSKQILCHNGEADALISTVFGECYIFVSDGKHWLAQTMNCTF